MRDNISSREMLCFCCSELSTSILDVVFNHSKSAPSSKEGHAELRVLLLMPTQLICSSKLSFSSLKSLIEKKKNVGIF